MADPPDRYTIKYKDDIRRFQNHEDAIVYVLGLPTTTEKIEVTKHGSWNKTLINLMGEVSEIQRLVKVVLDWKENSE
ncbi:MAG: hypothetical protein GF308_00345 [Candidatus Heimdallarchaeota archaeon]|nr:hypothetical protein [Candidatus Heimdallarchaeota archaeon]